MPNLAKANLLARKTRSMITIFGIALAVALMLVVFGIVNGFAKDFANRILNIGADIMVGDSQIGILYPSNVSSASYRKKIEPIKGVKVASPVLIESTPELKEVKQFNYIYGLDYDEFITLGSGFSFIAGGRLEKPYDIIIDNEIARINDVKVGEELKLFKQSWRVTGIVREALGARFYVDRKDLTEIMHPSRENICTVFYVKIEEGADVAKVAEEIEKTMGDEWSVRDVKSLFEQILGGAIGVKELMVALIGVSAIMCFSVILLSMYNAIIERTREIGILKSLGATKGFIVGQIMKEAAVIVVIGVLVGYGLSFMGQLIITQLFPILKMEITSEWMINSAIIAIAATMLGTLYPAIRASNLDPVEALSWE